MLRSFFFSFSISFLIVGTGGGDKVGVEAWAEFLMDICESKEDGRGERDTHTQSQPNNPCYSFLLKQIIVRIILCEYEGEEGGGGFHLNCQK